MLEYAYIRHREALPDSPNTFAAWEGFDKLGVKTRPYYGFGDIENLKLGPEACLVGFVGDVLAVMKQLGLPEPPPLDYPHELRSFLGRDIGQATLGDIRRSVHPVFIKPVQHKLFTGQTWTPERGPRLTLATYPDETPVHVSSVVNFVSEYRCFVLDGEILDVRRYKGDWSVAPDRDVVQAAVHAYKSAPIAYAIDFFITDDGETLVGEVNDAHSLGSYGLDSVLYAKMLEARWGQMMAR